MVPLNRRGGKNKKAPTHAGAVKAFFEGSVSLYAAAFPYARTNALTTAVRARDGLRPVTFLTAETHSLGAANSAASSVSCAVGLHFLAVFVSCSLMARPNSFTKALRPEGRSAGSLLAFFGLLTAILFDCAITDFGQKAPTGAKLRRRPMKGGQCVDGGLVFIVLFAGS